MAAGLAEVFTDAETEASGWSRWSRWSRRSDPHLQNQAGGHDPDTHLTFDLHHKPLPPSPSRPSRTPDLDLDANLEPDPHRIRSNVNPDPDPVLVWLRCRWVARCGLAFGTPLGLLWKAADSWQLVAALWDLNPGLMMLMLLNTPAPQGRGAVTRLFVDFCQTTRR